MNDRAKKERLLNEILAEETPAGFREVLLEDTLRLARRRRHFRQTRRAVSALAVVAGLALVVWRSLMPTGIPPEPSRPYVLVRTQPLPPQAVVDTQPLSPANLVSSSATAGVVTTAAAGYRSLEIDDDELLELAAPNPVVLIRHGPHEAELVFVNQPAQGARSGN